jgi:hypothetical protein
MQQQHEEEEMVMASSPPSLHSRLSPQPQSMTITRPSRSSLSPPATHHYQQQQHHDSTEDEIVEDLVAAVAGEGSSGLGLVIGAELATPDPVRHTFQSHRGINTLLKNCMVCFI